MYQHPLCIVPGIALAVVVAFPLSSAATGLAEIRGNDEMVMSVPKADTHFGPGLTYFVHGPAVIAVWSESGSSPPHTGGVYKWMFNAGAIQHELGHSLSLDHGGPVVPASGPEILFVTSDNGRLYKLDALSGAVIGHVDVRRGICPDDQITAPPAVQLYAKSNAAFQGAMQAERGGSDDLVYVITHHGCGDDDGNQVRAYYVSDLTLRWVFNSAGTYSMAAPSDGCEVDYATNTIYCGTPQEQAGQHTLWAIETLPATAQAARKWSYNAGSIQNRPMLGTAGELFLVRTDAIIEDRDPATGSLVWTMATGSPVVRNLWPEFRPGLPTRFYYVTEDGNLHGTLQNFPNPVALWPPIKPPTAGFSTMPAVATTLGKVYVGRDDGTLEQVSIDTGLLEGSVPVGRPGTLWDPALDYSGPNAADYDRLMITTTGGSDRRYCIGCGTAEAPLPRPVDFALAPGAPNPFSSRSRIGYRLPYDARVEIDVFAVDGRKVRTLVDESEAAGSHDASWDGLDDAGRSVEAGSYFYRMRAMGPSGQTLESSKKVQLVR